MSTATRDVDLYEDDVTPFSAAVENARAIGMIGYAALGSDTTPTLTVENAITCEDVPVKEGRCISITASGTVEATGPTGLQFRIIRDSTELLRADDSIHIGGTHRRFFIEAFDHSPDAGNHDYVLAYGIDGGGGESVLIRASSGKEARVIVRDEGEDF